MFKDPTQRARGVLHAQRAHEARRRSARTRTTRRRCPAKTASGCRAWADPGAPARRADPPVLGLLGALGAVRPAGRAGGAARARARGARRTRSRSRCARVVASREDGEAFARARAGGRLRGADRAADDGGAAGLRERGARRAAGAPGRGLDGAPPRARALPTSRHGDITTEGATVGTPMLTNVLVRRGRPFALVVGRIDDPGGAGAGCAALRAQVPWRAGCGSARVGRVGRPIDGYDCVDADPTPAAREHGHRARADRARGGARALPLDRAGADRGARARRRARPSRSSDSAEGETLHRSLRAACAIEDLVREHRLDAGAMNCHVPEIRFGAEVGIAPCFGLGRSTSAGVPWSCAGDVVTAIALLTTPPARRRGAVPRARVARLRDRRARDREQWRARPRASATRASGRRCDGTTGSPPTRCVGACACFGAPAGPATLVAFTELDAPFRATASSSPTASSPRTRWPATGTPYAAFRFRHGPRRRPGSAGRAPARTTTPRRRRATSARPSRRSRRFLGVEAVRV